MKYYKNFKKSKLLLILLLTLIVGASPAWGETVTANFNSQGIPEGWEIKGTLTYDDTRRYGSSGYGLTNSLKTDNRDNYLITEVLTGDVTYYFRRHASGSGAGTGYLYIYNVDESGNLTGNALDSKTSTSTTMTKYTYSIGGDSKRIAFVLVNAALDDVSGTKGTTSVDAPSMKVSATSYDFGLAAAGTTAKFTITNNGNTNYTIEASATNGYGTSLSTSTLNSGEKATLTVTMPSTTSDGVVTITSSDENIDDATINVTGVVREAGKLDEDFSGKALPNGWSETHMSSYVWSFSSEFAGYNSYTSSYAGTLTTPKLSFTAGEKFFFDAKINTTYQASGANITVQTSTDGSSFTDLETIGSSRLTYSGWTSFVVTIPSADVKYIRFAKCVYAAIDNVYGGTLPIKPKSLSVSKFAETATLTWDTSGEETAWQVYIDTDENAIDGEITPIDVNEKTYTFTDLTLGSTYFVWVRSNFGGGSYSEWEKSSFTLAPAAAAPTSVDGSGITEVAFGTGEEVVDNTTYPTSSPFYGNYLSQIGGVSAGLTANVDVTFNTGYTYGTVIWVDWNQNYEFEESEVVYKGTSGSTKPTTLNTSFNISASQPIGKYCMRIAAADSYYDSFISGGAYNTAYAYPTGTYTVVHDYTLKVNEAPSVLTPTDLVKNSVTATSATLSWTDNCDATAWQIKYSTTEAFDPDSEGTLVEADANPYSITELTPETTYYAYVRAKKGGDVSDWSNKVEFTTSELYPKPTAISVSAADISATFRWTNGEGTTPSAWQIKYSTDENFDPATEGTLQAVTTNPYALTGLTVGNTYYAYIRADYGESHYSSWSAKLTFTTGYNHELTVNNGTDNLEYVPFYGYYADNADRGNSQFIIPATQLSSINGETIKTLKFYTNAAVAWSAAGAPTVKIFIKEVDYTEFTSKSFVDWATLTEVYEGTVNITDQQYNITLDTPFTYGGSNLLIGFQEQGTAGYAHTYWYGTNTTTNCAVQNQSGSTSYNYSQFLPKTTFGYETLTGPRLEVSTDAIDFGDITQESTAGEKQKTFTISNTGVADLTGLAVSCSSAGYSVSALPRTTITAEGEGSDDIELTVTFAPTTSGSYDGTITVSATSQQDKVITLSATYTADPVMGVFNDSEATEAATTGQTVDFGYAQEAPTYTYYIKNTGVGTLDVAVNDGGLSVSPANASLGEGEQQAFTITANVAEVDATVTFTGTNHDGGAEVGTFNVTLQGTLMPLTSTFFEGFNYANGEATTTQLVGWEVNNSTNNLEFKNGQLLYSANVSEFANVVTPKLRVSGTSDVLRFSAYVKYTYASQKIVISYSADKTNWTEATSKVGSKDFDGAANTLKNFECSGIPEGSYYFKIELCDAAIDYFYGFSTTLPDAVEISETADNTGLDEAVRDIEVTYTKAAESWGTIALPFATTTEELGTIYGATINAYKMKSFDGSELVFEDATTLEAGKPYVIYSPEAMSGTKTFYNKAITAAAGSDEKGSGSTVTFAATYAPITAGGMTGKYGVTPTGRVLKGGASATMDALRGYLTTSDPGARLSVVIEDETTGIKTILDAEDVFGNDRIYNLKGQQVENAKKGIFIINGKKVVRK